MCEYAKWKLPWYIYVTKILCNQSTLYIFFIQFCSSLQQLYSILQESNSYHLKRQKHSTLKYFQVQKHWYEGGGGNYYSLTDKRTILNFSMWPFGTSGLGVPDIHLVSGSSRSGLSHLEAESSASFITNSTKQNQSGSQVTESSAEHKPLQNVREAHHTVRAGSLSGAFLSPCLVSTFYNRT